MPGLEDHRQKCEMAESARLALEKADSNQHADWIVIAAFYQALHLVDAFFALSDHHPKGHGPYYDEEQGREMPGRNALVNRHRDLSRIVENYRNLYDASIAARYDAETYRDDREEVEALLEEDLDRIVTHVNRLINQFQT